MDIESIHNADVLLRQANQTLADAGVGLTATQADALAFIGSELGGRTLGEVARHLGVTQAVVTGVVDRLQRARFVARVHSTGDYDRRVVYAQITEAGRIALDNAAQAFADYEAAKELVAA